MATQKLNIAIVALGINSSDDLRPLILLSRGLEKANEGVHTNLITHPQYADLLGEELIDFVDGGPCPFWARSHTPEGKSLESKGSGGDIGARLKVFMGMLTKQWFELGKAAIERLKPDVIILASTSAILVYPSLSELLGVKIVILDNSPLSKTSAFGPPRGFGSSQAGFRHVNLQRWSMHAKSMWSVLYQHGVNSLRSQYGLPLDNREDGPWTWLTTDDPTTPVLLTYSEALLPRPLEWSSKIKIVGPLFDSPITGNSNVKLPSLFGTFLNGSIGKPVVFISLGIQFNSFGNKDARLKVLKACTSEAIRVGWRCVVVCPSSTGVSQDALRGPDVHVLGNRQAGMATLSALWSHCSMVMCSGDPWIVHSALHHGLPITVIDFGRDDTSEAFWGGRVEALAVGPPPIPVATLTSSSSSVGAALESVISPGTFATNAKAISVRLVKDQTQSSPCERINDVLLVSLGRKEPIEQPPQPPPQSTPPPVAPPTPPTAPVSSLSAASTTESKTEPSDQKVTSPIEGAGGGQKVDPRPMAGFSFEHRGATDGNPDATNVWRKGDDHLFKVRVGPNYKKLGKKEPSGPSLYELYAVDLIQSTRRLTDFSQKLQYPQPNVDTHHADVPPIIVMNGSLPMESPSVMSPASDGKTLNVLFFFIIRQATCDALADLSTAPPAVRLLKEFCSKAPTNPDMFARFKCIGMARNYDEAGMPSMFKSFNGKPCLVRNCKTTKGGSGTLIRGSNFLEMNVNIRAWPYLAKQGLGFLFSNSKKADLDVGFVIEGKDNDELPEVLLGSARLTKLDLTSAHIWK